jgi:hypothetical protein
MNDFFSNLKGKVDKGVATISANSKATIEKTQVKSAIGNIERERNNLYQSLGLAMYNQWQATGELGQISDYLQSLTALQDKYILLQTKQEELARIEAERALVVGKMDTPKPPPVQRGILCACGHENSPTNNFCMNCGIKIELQSDTKPEEETTDEIICSCGAKGKIEDAFCYNCGQRRQS